MPALWEDVEVEALIWELTSYYPNLHHCRHGTQPGWFLLRLRFKIQNPLSSTPTPYYPHPHHCYFRLSQVKHHFKLLLFGYNKKVLNPFSLLKDEMRTRIAVTINKIWHRTANSNLHLQSAISASLSQIKWSDPKFVQMTYYRAQICANTNPHPHPHIWFEYEQPSRYIESKILLLNFVYMTSQSLKLIFSTE